MTDTATPSLLPLSGVGILVTRPKAQASELIEAISNKGGNAICFPVIEIVPRDPASVAADADRMAAPDIAIFVSRNAVAHGLPQAGAAVIAVIGPATADAVRAAGQRVDIEPAGGYDSESLLAEPALHDVSGKQVRIIRGGDGSDGTGRELLAATLRQRGASVDYLSVYERGIPSIAPGLLVEVESAWRDGKIHAIAVMSVVSLQNLATLLPQWCVQQLADMPLVTPVARVIKEVRYRYPASQPILASGPQADDMVDAIISSHIPGSHLQR